MAKTSGSQGLQEGDDTCCVEIAMDESSIAGAIRRTGKIMPKTIRLSRDKHIPFSSC